ncbi:MAG: replication initiation factor domain-containing protein [Bacilli bacterium]|nr:replication initiation factor domain-containing protein [Bacilli bacterium]
MELDNKKLSLTPPTNRGVVMTNNCEELSEYMLFDWLQFTILPLGSHCIPRYLDDKFIGSNPENIRDFYFSDESSNHSIYINSFDFVRFLFFHLFRVTLDDILINVDSPQNGYEVCYSYRNIKIMQAPSRNDMGTHVLISGNACRVLEELNISYKDLFLKLLKFNCNYTRVDISFDVFHNRFFTMSKVESAIKNVEVVTKFRNSVQFTKDNLISKDNIGKTIWFGSRTSDIQFVFYDKKKERIYNANNIIDDKLKYWYRLECRFKNEKASNVIYNYLYNEDFNLYIKSILNNYLSFRNKKISDSRRSRWPLKSWWSEFLETTDKIQFQSKPIEYSITKKKNWLDRVASRSQLSVLLSSIEDFNIDIATSNYLYDYFKYSVDKINDKDMEIINEYRIKQGLNPVQYEDIKSYISDIKDIIIEKKQE